MWESDEWIRLSAAKLTALSHGRPGRSYADTIAPVANLTLASGPCRIVDYGGGTGFEYFRVAEHVRHRERLEWRVVDSPRLAVVAEPHRGRHPLFFHADLATVPHPADILYINTSVQYFDDYRQTFDMCLRLQPRYVVLTRLLVSDKGTLTTRETIHTRSCACTFVSAHELEDFMADAGYTLASDVPCWEDLHKFDRGMAPQVRTLLGRYPVRDQVFVRRLNAQ